MPQPRDKVRSDGATKKNVAAEARTKHAQLTQKKKNKTKATSAPKAFFCLLSSAESIIDCFDKGRGEPVQFN